MSLLPSPQRQVEKVGAEHITCLNSQDLGGTGPAGTSALGSSRARGECIVVGDSHVNKDRYKEQAYTF